MTAKEIASGVLAVTTSTCAHCDCRLQIPEHERDASNPFGLYVYAFRLHFEPRNWLGSMTRARFYASFHLIEQPMDGF